MDQNPIKASSKWYSRWWARTIIIIFVVFLICLVVYGIYIIILSRNINNVTNQDRTLDPATWQKVKGTKDNYWIGAADPRLVIVEFSDFACPYCRQSFPTIREIGTKYADEVKIIYRDYPILTTYSTDLALAARCAGEQDLFWHMHDKLFLNQGVKTRGELINLARQIGADTEQFSACYDIREYYSQIAQDFADAKALGISGTPTWFIGGSKIEGEIPRDLFLFIIDDLLKNN